VCVQDGAMKSWMEPSHPKTIDDETWEWGQKVWFTNEHVDVHRTAPFLTPFVMATTQMTNTLLLNSNSRGPLFPPIYAYDSILGFR